MFLILTKKLEKVNNSFIPDDLIDKCGQDLRPKKRNCLFPVTV